MPEITGTVKAKSQYGVKMTDDGDWWNWSKPEYRGQPFDTSVVAGDTVHVEYAEADSGKVYISTIGKVTAKPAEFNASAEYVDDLPGVPFDDGEPAPSTALPVRESLILQENAITAASVMYAASIAAGQGDLPTTDEFNAYRKAIQAQG